VSLEPRTALVLGATGGIGSATAQSLVRHGWKVRALSRGGARTRRKEEWECLDEAVSASLRGLGCLA
jgi:NAD(P)-dependent dehydrogenase (short-subunit alcohol dehydrogenase family)